MDSRITKKLPLSLRASMSSNGRWHLSAEDVKSGLVVFSLSLTPEQLGNLLGSRGVETEDTLINVDPRHGMQHVHTTKLIFADGISTNTQAAYREYIKRSASMIDRGWSPDTDNFENYHRRVRVGDKAYQSVIFRKYVDYDSPLAVRYREWLNAIGGRTHEFEISDEE